MRSLRLHLILFATRSRFMAERQHFSNRLVEARFQGGGQVGPMDREARGG